MTVEQKEKLIQRITSGQSLKMLSWEFKMTPYQISQFAKQHGYVLRTGDYLSYAHKMSKKK